MMCYGSDSHLWLAENIPYKTQHREQLAGLTCKSNAFLVASHSCHHHVRSIQAVDKVGRERCPLCTLVNHISLDVCLQPQSGQHLARLQHMPATCCGCKCAL